MDDNADKLIGAATGLGILALTAGVAHEMTKPKGDLKCACTACSEKETRRRSSRKRRSCQTVNQESIDHRGRR